MNQTWNSLPRAGQAAQDSLFDVFEPLVPPLKKPRLDWNEEETEPICSPGDWWRFGEMHDRSTMSRDSFLHDFRVSSKMRDMVEKNGKTETQQQLTPNSTSQGGGFPFGNTLHETKKSVVQFPCDPMKGTTEKTRNIDQGNISDSAQQPSSAESKKMRFRSHQAENWTEKFEELLDFRLKNGHCLVPNAFKENPSLAEWVKRQRYQNKIKNEGKHSTMSDDRITALEKLSFVWNSHDAVWEERLKELNAFKAIFNDCSVPSNYAPNTQLAIWVKRQRRQYKFFTKGDSSTMTPYRIDRLNELGFAWDGRKPKRSYPKEAWTKTMPTFRR
jgi:hypothetical protein